MNTDERRSLQILNLKSEIPYLCLSVFIGGFIVL
jgi:hypothetical protein